MLMLVPGPHFEKQRSKGWFTGCSHFKDRTVILENLDGNNGFLSPKKKKMIRPISSYQACA